VVDLNSYDKHNYIQYGLRHKKSQPPKIKGLSRVEN